jgi:hypothetical protein
MISVAYLASLHHRGSALVVTSRQCHDIHLPGIMSHVVALDIFDVLDVSEKL